ncbi:drug/metabolite transporter (DMT)-like permease [Streptomyces griseochromogenes]|uniref:Drug/metabolite transporter (DMT)-like permease n=1 Tax=Streptomyces griseochromogenes TaxID=68214 RepID=A0ABS4LXM5_9ACTN|nr:DMT family transporter [Streptomyces griseochromogenes]MBP2052165.1 drug/metabolite transporter (DMT)-like permease [Streptomyces griseochromogenes]
MSALALSVLLSFVSAVAYAGGAIVQEQVAVSCPDESYMPLRRVGWWAGLALNALGGVLHVVALAYGPLSLVQPLGALTIVFALPMAALFVGRKAGATAWRGAIMATVGLAGLLSVVGSSDTHSLDTAQRVAVALVTGGAVVALMIAGRAAHRHPAVRSVLLATGAGIAFGMSSVFTKTVAVDWDNGISLGEVPSLAVIGVFAAAGVLLSQASYRGGGLAAPLATLTVVNPVLAAAVGILMFGETFSYGTTGTVLALGCGVVAGGGLILLTTERLEHAPAAEPVPEAESAGAGEVLVALPQQRAAVEPARKPQPDERDGELLDEPAADNALPDRLALEDTRRTDGFGLENVLGDMLVPSAPDFVPAPGGVRGAQGDGGSPAAAYAVPMSYLPLSASFHVVLPVPDRQHARVRS